KGWQVDLDDAIANCGKILAYVQKLDPVKDRIEIEDILLKLACEGGEYCARGVKRASSELMSHIVNKSAKFNLDPDKVYEMQLHQALLDQRSQLVQQQYNKIAQYALSLYPDAIKNDVHLFDVYRIYLSLGVIPLTDFERQKIGIGHLMGW